MTSSNAIATQNNDGFTLSHDATWWDLLTKLPSRVVSSIRQSLTDTDSQVVADHIMDGTVILDVESVSDALRLVRCVSRTTDSTDTLLERLTNIYSRFPPSHMHMARLSLLSQQHAGTGGAYDYAASVVYGAATMAIMEMRRDMLPRPPHSPHDVCARRRLHHSQEAPALRAMRPSQSVPVLPLQQSQKPKEDSYV